MPVSHRDTDFVEDGEAYTARGGIQAVVVRRGVEAVTRQSIASGLQHNTIISISHRIARSLLAAQRQREGKALADLKAERVVLSLKSRQTKILSSLGAVDLGK
jgi:hypothetical protein